MKNSWPIFGSSAWIYSRNRQYSTTRCDMFAVAVYVASILDYMPFKHSSVVALPLASVEPAFLIETICRCISHIKGMVSIVMGKETLASKGEQILYLIEPMINTLEVKFMIPMIDGICMAQPTTDYLLRVNLQRDTCSIQRIENYLAQFLVCHCPLTIVCETR